MKKSLIHRLTFACILIASFAALSGCGGGNNPATSRNYTVGGSVRGLDSGESVELLENNGNALTVSTDGTFVFANALVGGSPYEVTIGTQPSGETCTVSGGLGTVGTADVTSVAVSCVAGTESVLYSFTNGADGCTPMGSLIQASDGNLYGMTQAGGASGNGVVFEIN